MIHRATTVLIWVLMGSRLWGAAEQNVLTPEEQAEGWILLFDGETMFGWRPAGSADWQVEQGMLRVRSGEQCLLRTTTQFANFVLKVEFRCDRGTNSGIFLRTSPKPKDPGSDCYELNIAPPENPFPTGSLVQRLRSEVGAVEPNQWHTYEVRCDESRISVQLDGQIILEYTDPQWLGRGYIGLQHNRGAIDFRNVKLRPLGLSPLLNGRDLTGWIIAANQDGRFEVTQAGELSVRNGRGQLESEGHYADFVLQADCKTLDRQLNSGIFFRCVPGSVMDGYESQIHNGFQDGNRSRPVDCGTGGIFRRQNARRVVTDDLVWFRKTIIADGPHMAVWVNGYQVTDWTDQRPPNANPRRGLRLEPGSIMIQAHDPTTNLLFRRIEISETPARWIHRANPGNR